MDDPRYAYATEDEILEYFRTHEMDPNAMDLSDGGDDGSGTYKVSARQMLFPSSFSQDAKNMTKNAVCAECGVNTDLTLDHIIPVARWFNTTGYQCSKAQREQWYNDTNNLRVLCRKCNSKKGSGGYRFDSAKVAECIRRKLL